MTFENELVGYEYPISQSQIAETPAHPRDSAKLLVYDRKTETEQYDTFLHLDKYLEPGTLLILNDTKVVPARLPCYLPTGGKVELLWLENTSQQSQDKDIASPYFEALSPRTLDIGTTLSFDALTLTVLDKRDNIYVIAHNGTAKQFRDAMMRHGTTPIPPYLKHTPLSERKLRAEYQTIFAKREGSVAAPTASLHFTKRVFAKLRKKGIKIAYVTLHVNLGTFAPLTEEHLETGKLHEEWYEIPKATTAAILRAKKSGNPVIPVGTTALRTIESAFSHLVTKPGKAEGFFEALKPDEAKRELFSSKKKAYPKKPSAFSGTTSLFIRPGYQFAVADGLITNFHVPRSSLMMLVAALLDSHRGPTAADGQTKIRDLYRSALDHDFRFYSFGDGMLIR